MTKQGVPWLEIVLRENENARCYRWWKSKEWGKNGSNGSKRVKGGVDFFKRKKSERKKEGKTRRKNWFFNRLRVSTTPETRNVSTSLIG